MFDDSFRIVVRCVLGTLALGVYELSLRADPAGTPPLLGDASP